jgi:hypothetical protein
LAETEDDREMMKLACEAIAIGASETMRRRASPVDVPLIRKFNRWFEKTNGELWMGSMQYMFKDDWQHAILRETNLLSIFVDRARQNHILDWFMEEMRRSGAGLAHSSLYGRYPILNPDLERVSDLMVISSEEFIERYPEFVQELWWYSPGRIQYQIFLCEKLGFPKSKVDSFHLFKFFAIVKTVPRVSHSAWGVLTSDVIVRLVDFL